MTRISRRELLAGMLGAPWLAAQGCQQSESRLPPGRLVGANVALGHRLREHKATPAPPDHWETHDVVIVGGGMSGLSAARRLKQHGRADFVLLELETEPGGTSRSGSSPTCGFPWGAHYVPAPTHENGELVDLLNELDVFDGTDAAGDPIVAEQYRCRDPQERVFFKGTWYEGLYLHIAATPDDLAQLNRFNRLIDTWVQWRDDEGRRAFTIPMAAGSDDAEVRQLDRISMTQWLDAHRLTSPRLRWMVDYACRDDYGMHAAHTSAWAGVFYFAARKITPGVPSRPFITWPEGNGRIVDHLYTTVRDNVRLGWAVNSVCPVHTGEQRWLEVAAIAADGRAIGLRSRHVIMAVPQFITPHILTPYVQQCPPHVGEFQYGAWAVANLMLSSPPAGTGFPLAWDNVLYESPALGYVCDSYQRGITNGPAVITYYYALCDANADAARQRLLDVNRAGWAEIALRDLERAHPDIRRQTTRIDVMRWGHAMIRPRVGFMWGGARTAAATPVAGVHFAHCDLSGLPLFEEAFYRGTRAADEVLAQL